MRLTTLFTILLFFFTVQLYGQDDYEFYKGKGYEEYNDSKYENAEKAFSEALLNKPEDEDLRNKVIECREIIEGLKLDEENKFNEARNIFLKYVAVNKDGNFHLGFYYHRAKTTEGVDLKKALHHYKLAQDLGHLQAKDSIDMLIDLYMETAIDNYNNKNYKKAFEVFDAFKEVDGQAQYYIALSYEEGNGVDPNEDLALEYYLKASENGIAAAETKAAKYERSLWKAGNCDIIKKYNLEGGNAALKYILVPGMAQNKVRPNNGAFYGITAGAYGSLVSGIVLKLKSKQIYENEYLPENQFELANPYLEKANRMNHTGYILIGVGAAIWFSDFIAALSRGKKNQRALSECDDKSAFKISPLINQSEGSINIGFNLGF